MHIILKINPTINALHRLISNISIPDHCHPYNCMETRTAELLASFGLHGVIQMQVVPYSK